MTCLVHSARDWKDFIPPHLRSTDVQTREAYVAAVAQSAVNLAESVFVQTETEPSDVGSDKSDNDEWDCFATPRRATHHPRTSSVSVAETSTGPSVVSSLAESSPAQSSPRSSRSRKGGGGIRDGKFAKSIRGLFRGRKKRSPLATPSPFEQLKSRRRRRNRNQQTRTTRTPSVGSPAPSGYSHAVVVTVTFPGLGEGLRLFGARGCRPTSRNGNPQKRSVLANHQKLRLYLNFHRELVSETCKLVMGSGGTILSFDEDSVVAFWSAHDNFVEEDGGDSPYSRNRALACLACSAAFLVQSYFEHNVRNVYLSNSGRFVDHSPFPDPVAVESPEVRCHIGLSFGSLNLVQIALASSKASQRLLSAPTPSPGVFFSQRIVRHRCVFGEAVSRSFRVSKAARFWRCGILVDEPVAEFVAPVFVVRPVDVAVCIPHVEDVDQFLALSSSNESSGSSSFVVPEMSLADRFACRAVELLDGSVENTICLFEVTEAETRRCCRGGPPGTQINRVNERRDMATRVYVDAYESFRAGALSEALGGFDECARSWSDSLAKLRSRVCRDLIGRTLQLVETRKSSRRGCVKSQDRRSMSFDERPTPNVTLYSTITVFHGGEISLRDVVLGPTNEMWSFRKNC